MREGNTAHAGRERQEEEEGGGGRRELYKGYQVKLFTGTVQSIHADCGVHVQYPWKWRGGEGGPPHKREDD